MNQRTLTVVSSGLRQPSSTRLLADRLAVAARAALERRDVDAVAETIELRHHARDLTDHLLTGFATPNLRAALDLVAEADGVIAVTPIFSASYTGLFKNFFDVLEQDSLRGKPVLIGATAGTARHSLALEHAIRPLFTYLRALVTPTAVFAASEDWGADGGVDQALSERIDRAAAEFAELVAAYQNPGRPDPYGEVTPLGEMLNRRAEPSWRQ